VKNFLIILTAVLFGALPARADIVIGLAGPFTSSYATLGDQMRRGAGQAVADMNAAGGINGEKLVLREGDDACDPKQAVTVANQLINAGVKFVVGHACSGSSIVAAKLYAEENILMMTPMSTNPDLTKMGLTNVFRTCGRDDQEADVQAKYVLKHYHNKKIAILHDNSAVQHDLAERFKNNLNAAGVKEVLFDAYTPGEKDYSALIAKLMKDKVQVLVIAGYHVEAGLITRQMKQQNAEIQIISDDALATQEFWAITGKAGEDVLMSFEPDITKRANAKPIIERMRKNGYEPESYAFYSYAAIEALAEGLRRVGADPVKVAAALRRAPVKTVIGDIGFDANGDVTGSSFVMYRWHDGHYTEVTE
jgi:branched-chain amino acid transport system substrate-binding protein